MIVLALDAGVTTGFAILKSDDLRILSHGVISETDLALTCERLAGVADEVVIELALIKRGSLGARLEVVHETLLDVFPDAMKIDASKWKGSRAARSMVPKGIPTHVKDAIRIARWYVECEYGTLKV